MVKTQTESSHGILLGQLRAEQPFKQGAEGKVYKVPLHGSWTTYIPPTSHIQASSKSDTKTHMLLKHRFKKTYRHPSLDRSLTRQRLSAEARALLRAKRAGVAVPTVLLTDLEGGLIGMEWIEGRTLRSLVPSSPKPPSHAKSRTQTELGGATSSIPSTNSAGEGPATDSMSPETLQRIMFCIGQQLAKMHCADIIHGDLTTSNIMLRSSDTTDSQPKNADPEIVLIDFGLTQTSALAEDRAVDLYVLERAFSSTHPGSEDLFEAILEGYEHGWSSEQNHSLYASGWQLVTKAQGATEHRTIRNRLDEVRLRGRKRSMVG